MVRNHWLRVETNRKGYLGGGQRVLRGDICREQKLPVRWSSNLFKSLVRACDKKTVHLFTKQSMHAVYPNNPACMQFDMAAVLRTSLIARHGLTFYLNRPFCSLTRTWSNFAVVFMVVRAKRGDR
jgi:hypothetical protein